MTVFLPNAGVFMNKSFERSSLLDFFLSIVPHSTFKLAIQHIVGKTVRKSMK